MILSIFKKYKKEIIFGLLLSLSYLIIRLINLTIIPIFVDEAIYLHWARVANNDASWRFISLTDGKQPLFIWLTMVFLRLFNDPLFAGRFVSILSGLGTMLGLFLLGWQLFGKKWVGFLAAALYLFYPFALVYDRMALMDGMVGMFAVWALLFEVLLVRTLRLDVALILGMIIGGSILTKSTGFFNLYLLPFSLLLFPWQDKKRFKKLFLWLGLILIVVIEAQVIYSVLRLSPFFHMIAQKNNTFIYPFIEWKEHPWRFLIGNLIGLWDWFITYFSWPIFGLVILSLVSFRRYFKEKILLLAWFGAPFFALALFGKVLYPRFIFFMSLFILLLAALGFYKLFRILKKPFFFAVIGLLFIFPWLRVDWQLLTNPFLADIHKAEKGQYLNDWPAGGGINETVAFFNQEAKEEKIYVITEGTFGLLPYGLELYLYKNPNIEIQGIWPLPKEFPDEILEKTKERPTYFVFNQTQIVPLGWPIEFVAKYRKGVSEVYLQLYQVLEEE